MKPKPHANTNRRRGMKPRRTFDKLAADLARFDFSTRDGAHRFYCHAVETWTAGEIVFMAGMSLRIVQDESGARATATLDELSREAYAEMKSAARIGYLGARPHRLDALTEKTIPELQAARTRNPHPRKRTGADGQAVTKAEAAKRLGISRRALYDLLKNPRNAWGLYPAILDHARTFYAYCDENAARIAAHKSRKRNRTRKPDIRLTASGSVEKVAQIVDDDDEIFGSRVRRT